VPHMIIANVKSETAPENHILWCCFGSDIRKRARSNVIRMSEAGTPVRGSA
jgi:hypothetical protein